MNQSPEPVPIKALRSAPEKNFWEKNAPFFAVMIFALLTGWSVLGPHPLNPTDTGWLKSDQLEIHLGWAFFRQDPQWHFPLSFTKRLCYPDGAPAAYAGSIPIVAVAAKLFSAWLPANFQYLGIYSMLCFLLQGFFAWKLIRLFTADGLLAALGALFFVIAPPFVFRFIAHFDLIAHWILLASLWLYFAPRKSGNLFARPLGYALLLAIAGGISPYISLMCLMIAGTAAAREMFYQRPVRFVKLLPWMIPPLIMVASWIIFGFLEIGKKAHDYVGGGYRDSSMNILSPVDPHTNDPSVHSIILKNLENFHGQAEGYNYLGAGVIFMVPALLLCRRKIRGEFVRPEFVPLWVLTFICFLYALSATVTFGRTVILNLPLPHPVEMVFSTIRSSGRFFWPGYYFILLFLIQFIAKNFSRRTALFTLASLLCLQIADTASLRASVLQSHGLRDLAFSIFKDPFWQTLAPRFDKIVVLPAWQSRPNDPTNPGGAESWVPFGLLATSQGITTNTCNISRNRSVDLQAQNEILPDQVRAGDLDSDTLYVLSPYYLGRFVDSGYTHISGRIIDGMLVFWRDKTGNSANTQNLAAMLDTVLNRGVDLEEIADGLDYPRNLLDPLTPVIAIPYSLTSGFELTGEEQPLQSNGSRTEIIPLCHPGRVLDGKIIVDLSPVAGGPSQNVAVFFGKIPAGEFVVRERGKITIQVPPEAVGAGRITSLIFEWKNAGTEKQLHTGADTTRLRAVLIYSIRFQTL